MALATAAKAKLLLRELKSVKADLAFAKARCAQLEEENKILRDKGASDKGQNGEDDEIMVLIILIFLLFNTFWKLTVMRCFSFHESNPYKILTPLLIQNHKRLVLCVFSLIRNLTLSFLFNVRLKFTLGLFMIRALCFVVMWSDKASIGDTSC